MSGVQQFTKREVYEWGQGRRIDEGQKVLLGKDSLIKKVTCGGSHSAALLTDGRVFTWGEGRNGQLGLGTDIKKASGPTLVPQLGAEGDRVVGLWSGFASSAAYTEGGRLFIWGFDPFLGPTFEPRLFQTYQDAEVQEVVFGPSVVMILLLRNPLKMMRENHFPRIHRRASSFSVTSEVHVWGVSDKGLLGLGTQVTSQSEAVPIAALHNRGIVNISIGEFHASAVTELGHVLLWGSNEGYLNSSEQAILWEPQIVPDLNRICTAVCGTHCTFALSRDGLLYSWGKGRHGVLGHGSEEDQRLPKRLEVLKEVIGVATGGVHALAWNADGTLTSWGWGLGAKLGHRTDDDKLFPTIVSGIHRSKIVVAISCSFDRTVVTVETDVVAVHYKSERQKLPIYANTTAQDIITSMSIHLELTSVPVVLLDSAGHELDREDRMRLHSKRGRNFFLIHRPSLWEEESATLIFAPTASASRDGIPQVVGATMDNLIMWLTHHISTGPEFIDLFLLTYSNFMEPEVLLEKLIQRFTSPVFPPFLHPSMAAEARMIIQVRVINVLRKWIPGSYFETSRARDVQLVENLRVFLETHIEPKHPREAAFLRRLLTTNLRYSEADSERTREKFVGFRYNAPSSFLPDHMEAMDLFKYPALEVARQLAIVDHSYFFQKIFPNEFVNLGWSKREKNTLSPNVVACTNRFNNLTQWCAAEILRGDTNAARIQRAERFIDIAEESAKLQNMNAVMAIISGLTSAPVWRLRLWKKPGISLQHSETFTRLREIMSFDGNMATLRTYFTPLVNPKVPFLGIYLQDLTFFYDANPNCYEGNPSLINFSKWSKVGRVIEELTDMQEEPYNLRPIEPVIDYLLAACGFENHDQSAYQYSKLLEPDNEPVSPESERPSAPSILADGFTSLYQQSKSSPEVGGRAKKSTFESEVVVLNQRAKLELHASRDNLHADRRAFWRSLSEKLKVTPSSQANERAASTTFKRGHRLTRSQPNALRRVTIGLRPGAVDFKKVLISSCVLECSVESALLEYPVKGSEDSILFRSILRVVLRLSNCDLICNFVKEQGALAYDAKYRHLIGLLIGCYKDTSVSHRHMQIMETIEALGQLSPTALLPPQVEEGSLHAQLIELYAALVQFGRCCDIDVVSGEAAWVDPQRLLGAFRGDDLLGLQRFVFNTRSQCKMERPTSTSVRMSRHVRQDDKSKAAAGLSMPSRQFHARMTGSSAQEEETNFSEQPAFVTFSSKAIARTTTMHFLTDMYLSGITPIASREGELESLLIRMKNGSLSFMDPVRELLTSHVALVECLEDGTLQPQDFASDEMLKSYLSSMVEIVMFLPFLHSFLPLEQQTELHGIASKLLSLQMRCLEAIPEQ